MDPLDPLEVARKQTGFRWVDFCVGASAIVIALISLAIAPRQSKIMELQLGASVWPYLQFDTSNEDDQGRAVVSFDLENVGVGPARIHSLTMRYEGRPIHNPAELFAACCADLMASGAKPAWATSSASDQVLAPNRPRSLILLTATDSNQAFQQRLNTERFKVQLNLCYCSVLDKCWMLDSSKTDRVPLNACPPRQSDDFNG